MSKSKKNKKPAKVKIQKPLFSEPVAPIPEELVNVEILKDIKTSLGDAKVGDIKSLPATEAESLIAQEFAKKVK